MVNAKDSETELQKVLEPGEKILWAAPPDPWLYARPTFMFYIIAVPWTVFTFFWLNTVTGGFQWPKLTIAPIPWWMPWIAIGTGILLLLSGLWMLSAPYWIWRRGKRTMHVLTNRRALILDMNQPEKMLAQILEGKINFRITNPENTVSDMDVVCGTKKGMLFRAVKAPQSVIDQVSKAVWS